MEPAFKGLTGVNYNLTILIDDWITDTGYKIAFEKDVNFMTSVTADHIFEITLNITVIRYSMLNRHL